MPASVYTQEEVDLLLAGLEALIPAPMPDDVKAAFKTVLDWLLQQVSTEVT